jgi:transcriptional regulator with XRE-family HTH domain
MATPRRCIPNKLYEYRILAGYSQKEVAEILEFKSTNRISNWEKGTAFPSIKNIFSLSILYRTLPAELFCDLYRLQRKRIAISEKKFHSSKTKASALQSF